MDGTLLGNWIDATADLVSNQEMLINMIIMKDIYAIHRKYWIKIY